MKSRVMFIVVLVLGALLLVLAGCSTIASTPGELAQAVHVTLSDQQISADRSTFTPGQLYHFVVTNTGQVAHQFMMTPRGWDYDHMSMGERHHVALYMYDQVAPGQTKTFDYTFPASAVGQSYGFAYYQQGTDRWYPFAVQPHLQQRPGVGQETPRPGNGTPGMRHGTPRPGMNDNYGMFEH